MLYDKDIREPLFDFLEERFGKIRIIEEKMCIRDRSGSAPIQSASELIWPCATGPI